jgi:hypothetical protein
MREGKIKKLFLISTILLAGRFKDERLTKSWRPRLKLGKSFFAINRNMKKNKIVFALMALFCLSGSSYVQAQKKHWSTPHKALLPN